MTCRLCKARANEQPILETENFFVVPALGTFIPGYLLIVSNAHKLNFASIITSDEKIENELAILKEEIKSAVIYIYGEQPFFFEHGVVNPKKQSISCVDHAHIHVVPHRNIMEDIEKSYHLRPICGYDELARIPNNYIHYEYGDQEFFALPLGGVRQYVRQILADNIGIDYPKWDWRVEPHLQEFENTRQAMRQYFSKLKAA